MKLSPSTPVVRMPPPQSNEIHLRLYIAGRAPTSIIARANLERAVALIEGIPVNVEIIDILKQPSIALTEGVFVTPTLVRRKPTPIRTLVGSLDDIGQIVSLLKTA